MLKPVIAALVLVFLVAFSATVRAESSMDFIRYTFDTIRTVGQLKALYQNVKLTDDDQKALKQYFDRYDDSAQLPRFETSGSSVKFSVDSREHTLDFQRASSGVVKLDGRDLNLNFDKSMAFNVELIEKVIYQKIADRRSLPLNQALSLFEDRAVAGPELAGVGWAIAGAAAWAICEKRHCGEPLGAAIISPIYLTYVTIDYLFASKAEAKEAGFEELTCPKKDNGKLVMAFTLGNRKRIFEVSYTDQTFTTPANVTEFEENNQKVKSRLGRYFFNSSGKLHSEGSLNANVDLERKATAIRKIVEACKKDPKVGETMHAVYKKYSSHLRSSFTTPSAN
jgi:hypothetical protein